jgi:hypothetical protein
VSGSCSTNGGEEEGIEVIGRKARGKETTRKTMCRWVDNIKMNLLEIGLGGVGWIGLAQHRYRWRAPVNAVMNLWVA